MLINIQILHLNSNSRYNTQLRHKTYLVGFLQKEQMMASARLRSTRRYFSWYYLGRLMSAIIVAMALFTVCTTFLRRNEYLITRSDFVRNQLETLSNERLKKYIRDQRGKEPNYGFEVLTGNFRRML